MPAPVSGPVTTGGGGVTITLRPSIDFILRQSGEFRHRLENLVPLWDRFGPVMGAIEQARFDAEGPGWAPLAESTLRYRDGGPILQETGNLMQSLTDGQMDSVAPMSAEYGSDVFYGAFHQDGTEKMPARPPIEIDTDGRRKLEHEMVSWVNEVAASTWGAI